MEVRLSKKQKIQVLNSEDLYRIMQQILLRETKIGRNKEHFWTVGLANNNRILFIAGLTLSWVNKLGSEDSGAPPADSPGTSSRVVRTSFASIPGLSL